LHGHRRRVVDARQRAEEGVERAEVDFEAADVGDERRASLQLEASLRGPGCPISGFHEGRDGLLGKESEAVGLGVDADGTAIPEVDADAGKRKSHAPLSAGIAGTSLKGNAAGLRRSEKLAD